MKNNRTFLEKLLDGVEVEWKPLIKVASLTRGRVISKEYLADHLGDYPVYSSQTVNNGEIGKINSFDFDGEFVSWTTDGANAGTVFYRSGKFSITNVCGLITIQNNLELNYKFLFYWLSIEAKNHVYSGMGNPKLMSHQMEKILIPIPPLSVQTEIVKILDALTALTSELTSELILRRKQYEYYREKLLSEEELGKVGFEWKTLEELVEKTQNIRWQNNTKTYRYIDLTSVDRENNSITGTIEINALNAPSRAQKIVKENDIIFATTRPTQQRIASITKEFSGEIASTGYCVLRANTDIVLPKWLFYFLSTINFKNYVEENQSGSAYPAISDSKVKEFRIPVPDVTIQQSIIEKLDKFYGLTNSLLHGLPKEINNRTKQYLYYQKELLNFKGEDL
ncbi:restriction endonuclease subunit S [Aggregatibacter sp. HMT-949]|uniref:restriction endonuclease subunit S n=1 Tax=Aggregatibacter sp. HMT-949 TaxID=3235088 RepID=UPI00359C4E64